MELIPAIDLLGGQVVRLHKGDYAAITVYDADPIARARAFRDAGARRVHVVDLDGARGGVPAHLEVIQRMLELGIAVQVGGGIRSRDRAERWLAAGAERVVLGTAAVKAPAETEALCRAHPGRVVIAIDARGERVSVDGWLEDAGTDVKELAAQADAWGAAAILYTDIDRDGTGEGPAVERTAALQRAVGATVIASGGIGALAHLTALAAAGVREAVCGRALYDGVFTLEEARRAIDAG